MAFWAVAAHFAEKITLHRREAGAAAAGLGGVGVREDVAAFHQVLEAVVDGHAGQEREALRIDHDADVVAGQPGSVAVVGDVIRFHDIGQTRTAAAANAEAQERAGQIRLLARQIALDLFGRRFRDGDGGVDRLDG